MKQNDVFLERIERERKKLEKEWKKEWTRGRKKENKSQMEKWERDESFAECYMDVCIILASTLHSSWNNIKAQTALERKFRM